jgi:RNA polymerase sigma factor (sigma-70 family)
MGISLRYSFSKDDAVEVVNDAFIKVFNSINSYAGDKPFKPWLRSIVVNTAIDRRRKELKFQVNTGLDDAAPIMSYQPSAIENLNAKDILRLIKTLPAIQLTVFNLYEIDGYSHDEIAKMLAIPTSTSRAYLSRAKEKLRNILTKEEHHNDRAV